MPLISPHLKLILELRAVPSAFDYDMEIALRNEPFKLDIVTVRVVVIVAPARVE